MELGADDMVAIEDGNPVICTVDWDRRFRPVSLPVIHYAAPFTFSAISLGLTTNHTQINRARYSSVNIMRVIHQP